MANQRVGSPPGDPWAAPGPAILAFFVLAMAALLAVSSLADLPYARQLAAGGGVWGTVVVSSVQCGKNTCTTGGTFTSDDGSLTQGVSIGGRYAEGSEVRARAVPGHSRAVTDDGRRDYEGTRFAAGLSVPMAGVGVLLSVLWVRARRRIAREHTPR